VDFAFFLCFTLLTTGSMTVFLICDGRRSGWMAELASIPIRGGGFFGPDARFASNIFGYVSMAAREKSIKNLPSPVRSTTILFTNAKCTLKESSTMKYSIPKWFISFVCFSLSLHDPSTPNTFSLEARSFVCRPSSSSLLFFFFFFFSSSLPRRRSSSFSFLCCLLFPVSCFFFVVVYLFIFGILKGALIT
jgi:hypothetical protein